MDTVFTGIERAELPKRAVCSDFAAAAAKSSDRAPYGADLGKSRDQNEGREHLN